MRLSAIVHGASALPLLLTVTLAAQDPARDNYHAFIPPARQIVGETQASARFRLYGDASAEGYADVSPVDGIDDARARRLLLIAARFSPLLRRNTASVPLDVESAFRGRAVLHADSWQDGVLVRAESLDLGPPLPPPRYAAADRPKLGVDGTSDGHSGAGSLDVPDDSLLVTLLHRLHPRGMDARVAPPEGHVEEILFFDFPGSDAVSWRAAYGAAGAQPSRIYTHLFLRALEREAGDTEDARLQLVVQYWFFYPYNDGPNDHEGDWEHINVSLTTRAKMDPLVAGRDHGSGLTAAEVVQLLTDPYDAIVDSLAIRAVDYYFHHFVMRLDYLSSAGGEGSPGTRDRVHATNHIWEDGDFVKHALARRQQLAHGALSTHPLVFLGGNSKGPSELLHLRPRFRSAYNRDTHGSYPFPATWSRVGPVGETEKVHGRALPRLRRDSVAADSALARPWYELIDDDDFVAYRAEDIILLPDWERLEALVFTNAQVRRRWFWMLLPVRFGFPASRSPGSGLVKRADLGNSSPLGPPFKANWNRTGGSSESVEYFPAVLRVGGAPVSPWSSLQNGWGVFNVALAGWGLLPGGNVAVTQLLPWVSGTMNVAGTPQPRTVVDGQLPVRITSFGQGVFHQVGGDAFARLLPSAATVAASPAIAARRGGGGDGAAPGARDFRRRSTVGWRLWFNLHYGDRFSVENSYGTDTSEVSYSLGDGRSSIGRVRGTLVLRELTGGFRMNTVGTHDQTVQLYVRGGYAWTWYAVSGATIDGQSLGVGRVRGGYLPTLAPSRYWWPTTAYAGAGLELFAPKRRWLWQRLGYGVRAEASGFLHRLQACDGCGMNTERGDFALEAIFGW